MGGDSLYLLVRCRLNPSYSPLLHLQIINTFFLLSVSESRSLVQSRGSCGRFEDERLHEISLRAPESTFNLHLLDSELRSCAHLLNVAAGEERQLADDLSDR